MAFLEDALSGWGGIAVGVGAAIVGPALLPAIGTAIRPVAKGLVIGSLFVSGQVVALGAQVGTLAGEAWQQVSDLAAEATNEAKGAARSARG